MARQQRDGSAAVAALAEGDFSVLAKRFSGAGLAVTRPAPGVMRITPTGAVESTARVLLSVGVHGDETGPLEMLALLLDALALQGPALAVDLMVCVGNLKAIRAKRRFIDADLNRLFRPERANFGKAEEIERADALIAATGAFFNGACGPRWHLDLHAAIRPSLHPTFAIVPELIDAAGKAALTSWLGYAGIGAIVLNPTPAGTYSYFTAQHFGAMAGTLELGRVGILGQNDLSALAPIKLALETLLFGAAPTAAPGTPAIFRVAQEIIKLSDDFRLDFDGATPNFTALAPGAVIARDGDMVYTVKEVEELVLFPNPDVRAGLRAALMVVRQS